MEQSKDMRHEADTSEWSVSFSFATGGEQLITYSEYRNHRVHQGRAASGGRVD